MNLISTRQHLPGDNRYYYCFVSSICYCGPKLLYIKLFSSKVTHTFHFRHLKSIAGNLISSPGQMAATGSQVGVVVIIRTSHSYVGWDWLISIWLWVFFFGFSGFRPTAEINFPSQICVVARIDHEPLARQTGKPLLRQRGYINVFVFFSILQLKLKCHTVDCIVINSDQSWSQKTQLVRLQDNNKTLLFIIYSNMEFTWEAHHSIFD